jgi:ribonuclease HII
LAGAVFAAAVILDPEQNIPGLRDSKELGAGQRERLAQLIHERSLACAIAQASVEEIDSLNIFQASLLAMQRAVAALRVLPEAAWIDGKHCPELEIPSRAIIQGDAQIEAIAAASILAKTARDASMRTLHGLYPAYGFDRHKGYGTAEHLRCLEQHGACPIHRRSFAPVRRALERLARD